MSVTEHQKAGAMPVFLFSQLRLQVLAHMRIRGYSSFNETNNAPEGKTMSPIHYVNNTGTDIRFLESVFAEAYLAGVLAEDYADLFTIKILKGFNADGTDRMIINAA